MTTIFEALREDHETQRTLGSLLVETSGDSEGRDELFGRLRRELEAHAGAEERHFYVPLMEMDLTQEHARHSVHEHEQLDDMVAELQEIEYSSPHWLVKAKALVDKIEHHLSEEEKEVFPVAGKALTEDQKVSLAAAYRDDMERRKDDIEA